MFLIPSSSNSIEPRQGSRRGLRHRERGYHVYGQFRVPLSTTMLLTLSGGPSYFDASQELIAELETSERGFPFDEVDIVSTGVERVSGTAWGYNIGLERVLLGLTVQPLPARRISRPSGGRRWSAI